MTYKLRKEIKTKDKQIFTDVPWTAQQLSHMMQFMTKHYDKTSSIGSMYESKTRKELIIEFETYVDAFAFSAHISNYDIKIYNHESNRNFIIEKKDLNRLMFTLKLQNKL